MWPVITVSTGSGWTSGSSEVECTVVRGAFDDPDVPTPYPVEVAWDDLREVEFLGGGSALVTRRDGTEILLNDLHVQNSGGRYARDWVGGRPVIHYSFFNKIEMTEDTGKVRSADVIRITFDENSGRFRVCPVDQHYFPPDFLFCPYCGTETVWSD